MQSDRTESTDLSHLTFEQRQTWERLHQFANCWSEGEEAAILGAAPGECPYEWDYGENTPRRRWLEGFMMAVEMGKVLDVYLESKLYRDARMMYHREKNVGPVMGHLIFNVISRLMRRPRRWDAWNGD